MVWVRYFYLVLVLVDGAEEVEGTGALGNGVLRTGDMLENG